MQLIVLLASLSLIPSCKRKETPEPEDNKVERLIIVNRGSFISPENSKLSVLNFQNTLTKDIDNDIYLTANGREFIGTITDYAENSSFSLILANHGDDTLDRIEILDKNTFKFLGSIGAPDIQNPTKALIVNDSTAYIFCINTRNPWVGTVVNTEYIAVVNLFSQKVLKQILFTNLLGFNNSLLNMVFTDSTLYFGGENWTQTINTRTHELLENKNVFIDNLWRYTFIGKDHNGMVWMTTGNTIYSVNPISRTKEKEFYVEKSLYARFSNFVFSRNHHFLFFSYSSLLLSPIPEVIDNSKGITIKQSEINSLVNVNLPFINRSFNDLKFDYNETLLYGTGTHDIEQPGYLFRYHMDGELKDSIKIGVNPGKMYFSELK